MAAQRIEWRELVTHLHGQAHLATADADGRPHVSIVIAVVVGDALRFFTDLSSGKARNIAVNPQVSMMWSPQAEAYVRGQARLIDDASAKHELWSSGVLGYDPAQFWQTPTNPDLALFEVTPASASVMSFGADGPSYQRWRRNG